MDTDPLVRDYLSRLAAAAWPLPAERRSDLVGEVREHIESALIAAGGHDEVTVRNVLERLGAPEEIVAAEAEPGIAGAPAATGTPALADTPAPAPRPVAAVSPFGGMEIVALLLLTVGAVILPVVGPLTGLMLVWLSPRWTTREKAIASVIVLVLLILPIVLLLGVSAGAVGYPLGGG
jgi:uncharacterized membrane protein